MTAREPSEGTSRAVFWCRVVVTLALACSGGAATLADASAVVAAAAAAVSLFAAAVVGALFLAHRRRRHTLGLPLPFALRAVGLLGTLTVLLGVVAALGLLTPIAETVSVAALGLGYFFALGANNIDAEDHLCGWRGTAEIRLSRPFQRVVRLVDTYDRFAFLRRLLDFLAEARPAQHASNFALLAPKAMVCSLVLVAPSAAAQIWPLASAQDPSETTSPPSIPTPQPRPAEPTARDEPAAGTTGPTRPRTLCSSESGASAKTSVPDILREELRALVAGSTRLKRDGLGEGAAGCIGPMRQVPRQPGVYYVEGVCDGALRSLGVVSPSRRAHMLLQQRAEIAKTEVAAGQLLGASAILAVGKGDLQVLATTRGDRLAIRQQSSRGALAATSATGSEPCSVATDRNEPYVDLPPAATAAFRATLNATGRWAWPSLIDQTGTADKRGFPRTYAFIAEQPSALAGEAVCADESSCILVISGQRSRIDQATSVDACELARLGPVPAAGQRPDPTDPTACVR